MTRVCAHCGTEVDGDALFCPTCGEPLGTAAGPELPPAPDWPDLPPRPLPEPEGPVESDTDARPPADVAKGRGAVEPPVVPVPPVEEIEPSESPPPAPPPATHSWEQPVSEQPVPPWRRGAAVRAAEAQPAEPEPAEPEPVPGVEPAPPPSDSLNRAGPPARPQPAGVFRVPTLLSDWCAGAGAAVAVLAMLLPWRLGGPYTSGWGLASGVNLLFTIILLALLAVVFLPDILPPVPRRALLVLAVGLVGVGMGLDRLGLPVTGVGGILFLIASLGIAAGGAIAQLGYDRAVGGPQA